MDWFVILHYTDTVSCKKKLEWIRCFLWFANCRVLSAKHCVHLNLPGHSAVNSKVKGVGETYSAIDEKGDVSN